MLLEVHVRQLVCADCEVAYSAAGIGTGLMFNRISEPDLERIRQFLGTLALFAKKSTYEQ
jgi:hypothetical protein